MESVVQWEVIFRKQWFGLFILSFIFLWTMVFLFGTANVQRAVNLSALCTILLMSIHRRFLFYYNQELVALMQIE